MKKACQFTLTLLLSLATAASLSANVLIDVANFTPNGTASGGTGTGVGALNSSLGTIGTDNGMPVTTYTVTGLDLTSVGGGASEEFSFTVSYTATTDGTTAGTPQFNAFGNVSVTGGSDAQVDGTETLTATIALVSSSFAGLSLSGFTGARAGGVSATVNQEQGFFTWSGGSFEITSNANRNASIDPLDGITTIMLNIDTVDTPNAQMNLEGFGAQFVAVPEPSTYALLFGVSALGLILLRRRRLLA